MSDRLAEIEARLEDIPSWPYCDTQQARADIEWLIAENKRPQKELDSLTPDVLPEDLPRGLPDVCND